MTETTKADVMAVRAEPVAYGEGTRDGAHGEPLTGGGEGVRDGVHAEPAADDREGAHDGVRGEPVAGGGEGMRGGFVMAATMTEVPAR